MEKGGQKVDGNIIRPVLGIVSKSLEEKKEIILHHWEARCIAEVGSAKANATLALRNSIPLYLTHLSEALATNKRMDFKSVFDRDQEGERIGKLHGADRAKNKSYELTEVIFEYHILREVIFQELERDGEPLAPIQRDIIFDSIEQAVNDAAVEFSEILSSIQHTFVNTLTHDLKNPITAAKMNAEIIIKLPDVPEPARSSARRIVGSLGRLDSMIRDLLDVSRIRSGEALSLQFVDCDLKEIVQGVVDEMIHVYGERFIFHSVEPVVGHWSRDGLRRVLENLMGNAVKYGYPEKPITLELRRNKTSAEVSVHNEGQPIPEKEISLLFKAYARSKSANEGSSTGWGLGLALVSGVISAHKGTLRVNSAEGKGTTFTFEVPLI